MKRKRLLGNAKTAVVVVDRWEPVHVPDVRWAVIRHIPFALHDPFSCTISPAYSQPLARLYLFIRSAVYTTAVERTSL